MKDIFLWIEVSLALLLSLSILLQTKGDGMGSMGGSDESAGGEIYSTRRGAEKILHYATIVMAVLFALIALLFPLFSK
ncbi:MAG: preprotein translocase subunit SecG [Candidatus Peregrinibacteria bacterium]